MKDVATTTGCRDFTAANAHEELNCGFSYEIETRCSRDWTEWYIYMSVSYVLSDFPLGIQVCLCVFVYLYSYIRLFV